jgi:hypothetical protein
VGLYSNGACTTRQKSAGGAQSLVAKLPAGARKAPRASCKWHQTHGDALAPQAKKRPDRLPVGPGACHAGPAFAGCPADIAVSPKNASAGLRWSDGA